MHASSIAFVAVAALGCCGTVAAFGGRDAFESSRSPERQHPMGSIELVTKVPLPGPPTGLAVGRTRVGVSLAVEGIALYRRDDASLARRIRINGAATSIETDGSRFWIADLFHDRVLKVDETGAALGAFRVGGLPGGIALTGSDVWVLGLQEPSITLADRWTELPTVHLTFGRDELWPGAIATGPHGVWLATGHKTSLTLVDPDRHFTRGKIELWRVDRLSATTDGVWAGLQGPGTELAYVDGATLAVRPVDVPGRAWVTAIDAGSSLAVAVRGALLVLDPRTGAPRARTRLDPDCELTHVEVDGNDLWAVDATHNELLRFRIRLT